MSHELIPQFILAHRTAVEDGLRTKPPIFTLEVPKAFQDANGCCTHYTFSVVYNQPNEKFPRPTFFLNLLTGPDNLRNYSYLGLLHPDTGAVLITKKSAAQEGAMVVRLVRRLMAVVWKNDWKQFHTSGFKLNHIGKCGRCGKPLTVPQSVRCGLGPDCAAKMGVTWA